MQSLATCRQPCGKPVENYAEGNPRSHNYRLSRWLAQPYKGMLLAGLKAH